MFLLQAGLVPENRSRQLDGSPPRSVDTDSSRDLDDADADADDTAGSPIWSMCSSEMDDGEATNRSETGSKDADSSLDWTKIRIPAREVAEPGDEEGTALYVHGENQSQEIGMHLGFLGPGCAPVSGLLELLRHRDPRTFIPVQF